MKASAILPVQHNPPPPFGHYAASAAGEHPKHAGPPGEGEEGRGAGAHSHQV